MVAASRASMRPRRDQGRPASVPEAISSHAFLRELIRDPRFAATVNDIVVEFATPFHQDILDRFVVDGADVELTVVSIRCSRGASRTSRWP